MVASKSAIQPSELDEARLARRPRGDGRTREEEFGLVLFYNTKRFIDSRDMRCALGGNSPLIIVRRTG